MSAEFSAFKAMAFGLGAIFVVASVAPDVTGGRFDPLRLTKPGKGKGNRGDTTTSPTTKTCPDGSVIASTSTCLTSSPTPSPATTNSTDSVYPEATLIPSNFDVSTTLTASWGSGTIAPSNGSDVVGAFRFICGAGRLMYDDPIVHPGDPGASHLHQYYGNTAADGNSTFESLRASGDSTCNNMGNGTAANRSAYWMPAMFDGKGNVVLPDYVQVYYKREPIDSPACDPASPTRAGICVSIPNGIKFISGFSMATAKAGSQPGWFRCGTGPVWKASAEALSLATNSTCVAGTKLEATVASLKCWNGQLDSYDHMSHFAPMVRDASTDYVNKCPSTHPYLLPQFTIAAFYSIKAGDDLSLWTLSSDHMYPNLPRGGTLHFDYFEAWDSGVKDMWVQNCIGKKLNCSGGDLGNGKQLRGAAQPTYGWLNPNSRVPIPKGGMSGSM